MQLFFPTVRQTILADIIVWPALIIIATVIGRLIPQERIDRWNFFQPFSFETERFYRTVVRIDRWKHLLPDGAALRKRGFSKRHLKQTDCRYLRLFLSETKRAELIHLFSIAPFWVFGFWMKPVWIGIMFLLALAVYLPCILAQRYNRPRLQRLYDRKTKRDALAPPLEIFQRISS